MIAPIYTPPPAIIAYKQHDVSQVSFKSNLQILEPKAVWAAFEDISKIYRESGHCTEISAYLTKRLQKAGFAVKKTKDGSICAARGLNKDKNNAIILQSHMDIVGISSDGNPKKPIQMHLKDGWLYANDRTLGADDGIGVASMLAIADDVKFKKYPLEMIFTTDEETGMDGAISLTAKDFYGKYLVNIDSEAYGVITKGCAGISEFSVKEKIKMIPLKSCNYKKISINISGASGGHSAGIRPDSINPIKVLISEIKGKDLNLITLSGGERFNAIPRNAEVEFLINKKNAREFEKTLKAHLDKIKMDNLDQNPDLTYSVLSEDAEIGIKYINPKFQTKMLDALDSVPTGLFTKFEDNGSTKTSQNLGVLKIADGEFSVQVMGRSSDLQEGQNLQKATSDIFSKLFGKPIQVSDTTPIWQPKENSILSDIAVKSYSAISKGQTPKTQVEHGGLESAIFIEKKPDLDEISIGPTLENPHSTKERVKVDTVLPFYNWLSKILETLAGK